MGACFDNLLGRKLGSSVEREKRHVMRLISSSFSLSLEYHMISFSLFP
jgi:hypothetical protein